MRKAKKTLPPSTSHEDMLRKEDIEEQIVLSKLTNFSSSIIDKSPLVVKKYIIEHESISERDVAKMLGKEIVSKIDEACLKKLAHLYEITGIMWDPQAVRDLREENTDLYSMHRNLSGEKELEQWINDNINPAVVKAANSKMDNSNYDYMAIRASAFFIAEKILLTALSYPKSKIDKIIREKIFGAQHENYRAEAVLALIDAAENKKVM